MHWHRAITRCQDRIVGGAQRERRRGVGGERGRRW